MRRLTKIAAAIRSRARLALVGCANDGDEAGGRRGTTSATATATAPRSVWPTTSAAVATSRSTTPLPPAWTGRRGARRHLHRGRGHRRRGRSPARTACAPWPRPATTRSSGSASPTPRRRPVAPDYPDVNFAMIDDPRRGRDNVAYLGFAEEQGSFLVGAAAALKTQADHVGFVGGVDIPLIQKFEAGYVAGVEAVNPDIKVDVTYHRGADLAGFNDPAKGKAAAEGMYDDGADIVYHAAGGSGAGVFDAAAEAGDGKWAIGVDSDQYLTASDAGQPRHPHLDAQAGRLGGVRLHPVGRRRQPLSRLPVLRPEGRRRRLLHHRWLQSTTSPPARRLQAADQRRRDQGPDQPSMTAPGAAGPGHAVASPGPAAGPDLSGPQPTTTCNQRRTTATASPGRDASSAGSASGSPAWSPTTTSTSRSAGTVHALVGENGAGKSTLMKILYGVQKPDEGTIEVNGEDGLVRLARPTRSPAGIGMVFQHFMLADNLTVLENVVLGAEKLHGIGDEGAREINEISDAVRLRPRPRRAGRGPRRRRPAAGGDPQGALPRRQDHHPRRADRRCWSRRRSTRSSTTCASSRREGHTVLFISHKLDEVLAIADDITVIRRGTTVATRAAGRRHRRELAELMVGSELPSPETEESTVTDRSVLEVRDLTAPRLDGRAAADRHRPHASTAARCSASPASRATARPSSSRRSWACAQPAGQVVLAGQDISGWGTRERREGGHRLHPRGPAPARPAARRAAVGEPHPGPPDPQPASRGSWIDRAARARTPSASSSEYDVRTPGIDTTRPRPLRRQPAEVHRRPRDERRARPADRRPPDPRRRRRRRRRRSGTTSGGPPRGPRGAAHLRRPRRADRPLRPDPGDPARPARR